MKHLNGYCEIVDLMCILYLDAYFSECLQKSADRCFGGISVLVFSFVPMSSGFLLSLHPPLTNTCNLDKMLHVTCC